MEKNKAKILMNLITLLCIAGLILLCVIGVKNGLFTSRQAMEAFVQKSGMWGAAAFILLQIVQVVIPVIPGAVSCAAGVVLFGPWYGLLYNYIGVVTGSAINFFLARKHGKCFVRYFVKEETYDKYETWLEKGKKFDKFFLLSIVLPCMPDDLLCMVAGLTRMSWKKFSAILLLGKPASIAAYSMAAVYVGSVTGAMFV